MSRSLSESSRPLPRWKSLLFSLLPLLLLLGVAEIGLSIIYFQMKGNRPLAIIQATETAIEKVREWKTQRAVDEELDRLKALGLEKLVQLEIEKRFLDDPPIRKFILDRYEHHFKRLLDAVQESGSRFLILYIPYQVTYERTGEFHRRWFADLAKKYDVPILDMSDMLLPYGWEVISLIPFDPHPTRFSNLLTARELVRVLEPWRTHRVQPRVLREKGPQVMGELIPNLYAIRGNSFDVPYRLITNAYGFRTEENFPIDTPRQKILVLGDSFTYGLFLPEKDTFTTILNRLRPDSIVMNAGNLGYTIRDEEEAFVRRSRFARPDITILQVLDNDTMGMFYFRLNQYRHPDTPLVEPTPIEAEFVRKIQKEMGRLPKEDSPRP